MIDEVSFLHLLVYDISPVVTVILYLSLTVPCLLCCPTIIAPSVPVLESSVLSGPEKIRSRDPWSHIVS